MPVEASDHHSAGVTSLKLLDQAKAQLPEAWETLVRLYRPLIRYWCIDRGLNDRSSQEVEQDVLTIVFEHLPRFEHSGAPGSFRAWLRRITRNLIVDRFRNGSGMVQALGGSTALGRLHQVPDPKGEDDPDERQLSQELSVLYRQAWELIRDSYSPRDCEIFRRVAENGERPKDVAEDIGVSSNTVSIAVSRIKKCLRDRFEDAISA